MRLLGTVMAIPLVDGVFPALILAGALDTLGGVFQVGLLVFAGSATVAVVLVEMDDNPRSQIPAISALGLALVIIAAVEAALAPTLAGIVNLAIFERFAGIVILAVAASTTSARIAEYIPRPAVLVGLGFIASVQPADVTLALTVDYSLVVHGAAAAGVGAGFALLLALFASELRRLVDLDRFRFGSAVALGTLGFSLFGLVPGNVSLAVLAVSVLLAFDPRSDFLEDVFNHDNTVTDGGDIDDDDTADSNSERDPWL